MSGTMLRLAAGTAVATAASALALVGCGGGGSSSTAPTTTPSTSQQAPKRGPLTDPAPLPNQGTGAVAPGVPTSKGGDNSIQTYGIEAESQERVEVAALVQAFLTEQAERRWGAACTHLTARVRIGLAALARRVPGASEGCAGGTAAVLGEAPSSELRRAARIHVLSFRVGGAQGFVVYRDGGGRAFNLPLSREGGEWRIGSLTGIALAL